MIEVQKENQESINKLKEWQGEAYVFVLLYCCLDFHVDRKNGFDLSKLCALFEIVGDIFRWKISLIAAYKVKLQPSAAMFLHDDFRTNLRLLPKECHDEIYNKCHIILQKSDPKVNYMIGQIIEQELK